jgi:restriction system protein
VTVPWLRGREYLEITPTQFETCVLGWLRNCDDTLKEFKVVHSDTVQGDSGDYEIDIHVEFSVFGGAKLTVLVECKRYRNPVKRDIVLILDSKLRDTSAHKGMIFATSGFQSGAIEYGTKRGIALINVADGSLNYLARSEGAGNIAPPPWVDVPNYVGWFQTSDDGKSISNSMISDKRFDPLLEWLSNDAS